MSEPLTPYVTPGADRPFTTATVIPVRPGDPRLARVRLDETQVSTEQNADGPVFLVIGRQAPREAIEHACQRFGLVPDEALAALEEGCDHDEALRYRFGLPVLEVLGDSMVNEGKWGYPAGSKLHIDPDQAGDCRHGDEVIARLASGEQVFRRLAIEGGERRLDPLNPAYPIIPEPFDVTALVIAVTKQVRLRTTNG